MPTFRITGPDGSTYNVTGPDGSTADQALERVKAQHKPTSHDLTNRVVNQGLSSINEALIGVPEGLMNMASGLTDPVMRVAFGKDKVAAAQGQRKAVFDKAQQTFVSAPSNAARVTGRIASTIPLNALKAPAALSKFAPIATRAIQGALGGLGVRDQGDSEGSSALWGAGANMVLPPLLSKATSWLGNTRPAQYLAGKIAPIADSALNAVDDFVGAPRALPRPVPAPRIQPPVAALGPSAQARAANFKKVGVTQPTTGMVTRDPAVWTAERELQKNAALGGELTARFQKIDGELDTAARNLVSSRGGAVSPEETGVALRKALDAKQGEMQKVTSALYTQVRETRGDVAAGPLQSFRAALDDPNFTDNPVMDQMREGVQRRLARFGMAGKSGLLRKDAVATVTQAEELRKFVGGLGDGKDPTVRLARRNLIEALDDDVVGTLGDDAFQQARASAKARFAEFNKTFAGKIAGEGVADELLAKRVLSDGVRLSDIRSLKSSLTVGTPEQVARGSEAWNKLGSRAMEDFISGARNTDGTLSGAALNRNLNKNGAKLRELLTPDEYKQLARFIAAVKDARTGPAYSAVNHSNTASAAANLFTNGSGTAPVGRGVIKNVLQHIAAFAAGGPAANVALGVGKAAAADVASAKAAKLAANQVGLALSPEAAAKAMMAQRAKALREAGILAAVKRGQNFATRAPGLFPALGPNPGSRR